MHRIFILFLTVFILKTETGLTQSREVIENYISTYRGLAIAEMQRTGVPASIKLAQGILETTAGTSDLVLRSNNHFGIKCKSNWTGESVSHTDDAPNECFRKYPSADDSYRDHSDFLKNGSRYAFLFKLNPEDYKGWANGLKKAGYATNPRYPLIIIRFIEEYHLQDYTLIALGKMKAPEQGWTNKLPDQKLPKAASETDAIVQENELPKTTITVSYPATEFRINETRVVYAMAGTSLLTLARQYDIPLKRIFDFNDMDEQESLAQAQLIYLQRKRKTGETDFHIVQQGESLYDIAQAKAIRLEALLELNHLAHGMQPAAGSQLYLKRKAPARPELITGEISSRSWQTPQ